MPRPMSGTAGPSAEGAGKAVGRGAGGASEGQAHGFRAAVFKRFTRPVRGCCLGRCGSAECVICVNALGVRRRGTVMFGERGRFFWWSGMFSIVDVTRGVKGDNGTGDERFPAFVYAGRGDASHGPSLAVPRPTTDDIARLDHVSPGLEQQEAPSACDGPVPEPGCFACVCHYRPPAAAI